MRFEIETATRRRIVEITPAAGGYRAVIDGQVREVDVARAGDVWSVLVGPAHAGRVDPRRSYEVTIDPPAGEDLIVRVGGRPLAVRVADLAGGDPHRHGAFGRRRRGGEESDPARGPRRVVAPMPGRIVNVLVKAGDTVVARQGLVVVEAMKMENELRAVSAGTVTEVRVAPGALVEANTVLVVIE